MKPNANCFVFEGPGIKGRVDLATTSGGVDIQLSYAGHELRSHPIRSTDHGWVVSSTVSERIDGDTVDIDVLLPVVNIDKGPEAFATLAILTTSHNNIGGPDRVQGQLQSYQALALSGSASLIES
jgi:hypothetical protein